MGGEQVVRAEKVSMRFLADGPALPDDLLTAPDQGQVIFFCGAWVSKAKVNLPDRFRR